MTEWSEFILTEINGWYNSNDRRKFILFFDYARNDLNKWLKHVKREHRKRMKTRIKIHETKCGPPRVHRMNWKARFGVLTSWRLEKTKNERWMSKNGWKSSRNYSRKCYRSASAWIFFTETIFLSNFERIRSVMKAEPLPSSLLPLFIAKKGRSLPPNSPRRAQLAQASKVASSRSNNLLEEESGRPKWSWLLFVPHFLLNAPPFTFFGNSFSVMLRNFTNFVTILIFLPQGYESLRIMYLLFF